MNMLNQRRPDRIVRGQNSLHQRTREFEIRFEDSLLFKNKLYSHIASLSCGVSHDISDNGQ